MFLRRRVAFISIYRSVDMIFSSQFFVYFFMAVLFPIYFLTKSTGARKIILIVFSLVFYAWGEPLYVFLMFFMVAANYFAGLIIDSRRTLAGARAWLAVAVVIDLSILCVFKYTGLFAETVNNVFHAGLPVPNIRMPIGISFFTFQAMSYVIDVYRRDVRVQRSFVNLLLYVSFFAQLIAGPIVRYKDIESQLDERRVRLYDFNDGVFRFSVGLAKKILIADKCALAVNSLYALPNVTFVARWAGAFFYALQIYFDFSGYSDMAIGLGKMFGFKFLENFRHPYASSSATEFWRRWHISLGTFFRDYVYIPLGGNRRHHLRNIFVVWLLTGFWHGASWNFVLWGLFYALLLIFEKKFFLDYLKRIPRVVSFIISKFYFIFITVFGFAIFYFTKNTFVSLGYLFGIGVKSFTDIFTNSVLASNVFLLFGGVILALPFVPWLLKTIGSKLKVSYGFYRYSRTLCELALIALSTISLVGSGFSPFLYWAF